MANQGIAFLNREGQVGWARKEDFVNFSPEVKGTLSKTAFFWLPQEKVTAQDYQKLAEKALNYDPFQGVDDPEKD